MRLTLLALVAVSACSGTPVFGVSAPGEPARVEWQSSEAAGGTVYEAQITIDSATARYEVHRCQGPVTGECVTTEQRSGTVPPAVLQRLFEAAQTRDFRELKAEYQFSGDVVPPDGGWTELSVVVGEREKIVRWSKHVQVPEAIRDFNCILLAAIEALLCD
jgi:hypothetical protein